MKVFVMGTTPMPGTEQFVVAVGNHMEHWTIDQVHAHVAAGGNIEQADPHIGLTEPQRRGGR